MAIRMYDWSGGDLIERTWLGDFERAPLAVTQEVVQPQMPTEGARSVAERVTVAELSGPTVVSYEGPNTADPTGFGDRVIIGRLPDGKYGVRVISASGVRRVQIGEQDDGKYGMRVYDNVGGLVIDDTTAA
jgi:hypothetical protein